jgi:PHD/YefM family antitoxin component YafN of YafNO toxin-antitoxin module
MKTITLSNARKDLFKLRNDISATHTPALITHKSGNIIMIPEDDYWNIIEHLHIMKDKVAMDALKDAINDRQKQKSKRIYKGAKELLNELEI